MAGRPRTKANRADALRLILSRDVQWPLLNLVPKQYVERPNLKDPLCCMWREAARACIVAEEQLQKLSDALWVKAGGRPDPEPFDDDWDEDEEVEGPTEGVNEG